MFGLQSPEEVGRSREIPSRRSLQNLQRFFSNQVEKSAWLIDPVERVKVIEKRDRHFYLSG